MSKKLLLADDSITIQKVIGITFANEDYALEIVDNGDAALAKALSDRPDLILADVYMPGKNGYELCDTVKKEASLAAVPVLLLTGTFEPFDEERARAVGADDWIAKPFESQMLIDKVEELLAKGAQAEQGAAPVEVPPVAETVGSPPSVQAAAQATAPIAQPEEATFEDDVDFDSLLAAGEDDLIDEPQTWADEPEPLERHAEEPLLEEGAPVEDELLFEEVSEEEDLWGAVSLEEESLMEEFAEEEPVGDDLWGSLNEELTAEVSPAPSVTMTSSETDVLPEEDEEEILALDEGDILETEELLGGEDDLTGGGGQENAFGFDEDEFLAAAEPPVQEPSFAQPEEFTFGDEELILGEAEEDVAPAEMLTTPTESLSGVAFDEATELEEPETEVVQAGQISVGLVEEGSPSEMAASAAASAPKVEQQVQALSEADLTRIVEQVAVKVLEKIAWEVVPDLAENMITEEIRKLKDGAA